jgi:hypothetical protein
LRASVLSGFIWLRARSTDGQDRRQRAQDSVKRNCFWKPPPPSKGAAVKNLDTKSERQTVMCRVSWLGVKRLDFISTNSDTATKAKKKKLTQFIRAPSPFPYRHLRKFVTAYFFSPPVALCPDCGSWPPLMVLHSHTHCTQHIQ